MSTEINKTITESKRHKRVNSMRQNVFYTIKNKENKQLFKLSKKTEKITSAIFMVSELLTSQDPLRQHLRTVGLELLEITFRMARTKAHLVEEVLQECILTCEHVHSLLDILHMNMALSDMNHAILVHEIELLEKSFIENVKYDTRYRFEEYSAITNMRLAPHFFGTEFDDTPTQIETETTPRTSDEVTSLHTQGHAVTSKIKKTSPEILKDNIKDIQKSKGQNVVYKSPKSDSEESSSFVSQFKYERRTIMLSLIKRKGSATMQDITEIIKNCSTKTLQREIQELIDEGIVIKKGNRRWTTYFLS
jgi:predicted transcriptional regulator